MNIPLVPRSAVPVALGRTLVVLAAAVLPAACTSTPLDTPQWHVTVMPARDDPERIVAIPPDCAPVASTRPGNDIRPGSWHNEGLGFGCSNARNLAVTIAEPRDLLGGRALAPADAEREAAAVDRYRKGQEKRLMRESTRGESSSGAQ